MSSRWSRRLVAVFVGGVMLAMIPAVSLGETTRVKATDGNSWRPAHKFIGRGDTVKWTNPSPRKHNIASMNAATDWSFFKRLPRNESRSKKFTRRGTFYYRCTIHSTVNKGDCDGMCGIVHVN